MAGSPVLKVYNSSNEYVGCLKHYEDAACIVASYGTGAQVRYGHGKKHILWNEGSEEFSAGESYDRAGHVMREREAAIYSKSPVKD